MTTYEIIPTTVAHVKELAETMRWDDTAEVWASAHYTPWEALVASIRLTDETYTALADGWVLCIFGVGKATIMSDQGAPWMLSSVFVEQHMRTWARGSRVAMSYLINNSGVDHLKNYVDARYTVAVRWLAWLGFKIHPAEPFGIDQLPFHAFTWDRADV